MDDPLAFRTDDFDYNLPAELIAQVPVEPRDESRLMLVNRENDEIDHHRFFELPDFLQSGDVMVFNDSRVLPARLAGKKAGTGGRVEILLLRRLDTDTWEALVKPGKRVKKGTMLELGGGSVMAEIIEEGEAGGRTIRFSQDSLLPGLGQIALPPYIHTPLGNPERYQTIYAEQPGSVAAPTAGLHFTPRLLQVINDKGIKCLFVTLHIGLDTFRPVQEDDPRKHRIHREYGIVTAGVAGEIALARKEGRRIIGVGTTSVRMLEMLAQASPLPEIKPFADWVDLYILPGHKFKLVDTMITNFHLPRSTLLMMVSAFAGKDLIDRAYREAIARKYRFYSFGDAMIIM